MERFEQLYLPAPDGHAQIALYVWRPEGPARAALQIVHGMREHMGRYDHFARFLADNGFAVYGHDHMGHGLTTSDGETIGYFGKRGGPARLIAGCRAVNDRIKLDYPLLPVFMLGHSMGSFISREYIVARDGPDASPYGARLAGYITMATGGPLPGARTGRAVARVLSAVRGTGTGNIMDILAFGSYNKRFPEHTRLAWLSRDMDVITRYKSDPLIVPRFTYPAFRDLISMQVNVNRKNWADKVSKQLPVLIMSGGDDPVGRYGKGVEVVRRRLADAGVADVTLKLYDGARHEVLNELNKDEVYADILSWLHAHIPA